MSSDRPPFYSKAVEGQPVYARPWELMQYRIGGHTPAEREIRVKHTADRYIIKSECGPEKHTGWC